jgi:hypothetical protein
VLWDWLGLSEGPQAGRPGAPVQTTRSAEHSTCPEPLTHHIQVLGNTPLPQLLHPLAHVRDAGVVIICVLLRQVVDVSQWTILTGKREGSKRQEKNKGGQVSLPGKNPMPSDQPPHSVSRNNGGYLLPGGHVPGCFMCEISLSGHTLRWDLFLTVPMGTR